MFPKRRRITRHEFETDPRAGSTLHAAHLSLRVHASPTATLKASVVVSKKTAKRSVDRHVLKRRVYDALERFEKKQALPVAAYIFFAKKDAHTIPFSALLVEVQTLLEDARPLIEKKHALV